ncbi:hypothetical protein PCL_05717 [Purpureocillium lilacinum]|uniref:Siroheme synthase n=1 Tax=Purpureocillium lilacinum TaxID=33203 RepID=A0A2U3EKM2_PURLI|nr:hypothetical protein Purlil1_11096 [Purpureocillium lilacinum]PWI75059.1 hypothetical protein PCL_05717 [Purpureocillium lilacinum]GJN70707.1 hypothetical protein PLICBS_004765 [Purpureocillium lilacinum]
MPPRRAASRAASNSHDGSSEDVSPPFFNTTFSTHRVSPLFVGAEGLTSARLQHLARRLRDTLVGDVVRGIQVGLEAADTPMGQVGALRSVSIRWFQAEGLLGDAAAEELERDESWSRLPEEQKRGLWVEIRHENATYVAVLLPAFSAGHEVSKPFPWAVDTDAKAVGQSDRSQFVSLPLLLLRMPQALKVVISEWLSSAFDCHVSKLVLGTKTLVNVWEGWIQARGLPNKGPDFVLTLSFNAPLSDTQNTIADSDDDADSKEEPGLRTLEITISPSDLRRFVRAGEEDGPYRPSTTNTWANDARECRRLAGRHADDGWAWRSLDRPPNHPFTEALARYLDHHLALNLFHPGVRVVQISCGAFVLAQSRLKVVKLGDVTADLASAAWMFVTQLGARLQDDGLAAVK